MLKKVLFLNTLTSDTGLKFLKRQIITEKAIAPITLRRIDDISMYSMETKILLVIVGYLYHFMEMS